MKRVEVVVVVCTVVAVVAAAILIIPLIPVKSNTQIGRTCEDVQSAITSTYNFNLNGGDGGYTETANGTLIANGAPEIRVSIAQFLDYLPHTEVLFVYFQQLNATTGMFFFSTDSGVYITECSSA